MKGNDDVRYLYRDLANLPEGISMVNAKLVQMEAGGLFKAIMPSAPTWQSSLFVIQRPQFQLQENRSFGINMKKRPTTS